MTFNQVTIYKRLRFEQCTIEELPCTILKINAQNAKKIITQEYMTVDVNRKGRHGLENNRVQISRNVIAFLAVLYYNRTCKKNLPFKNFFYITPYLIIYTPLEIPW